MTNLSDEVKKKIEEASESFKLSDIPYPPLKNIFKAGCKYGYEIGREEIINTKSEVYGSINKGATSAIINLQSQVQLLEDALKETKKDIEHNATDTLWSHDGMPMTIVDRIEIALESLSQLRGGVNE